MGFPDNLRRLRIERNLTQQALGDLFHISRTTISNYETGKQEPSLKLLVDFAAFFGVSVDQLLIAE